MINHTFKDEVAIVTGAGQGIGFEIARQLALNGASVILNEIDERAAENAAEKITAEGGIVHPMVGDAAGMHFIQQMVDETVRRFGKLTIAVANVGVTIHGDFFEYTQENFNKTVNTNLFGTFFFAQAAAKQIREQRTGGSILLMSSVNAHQANKYLAVYSMSKAGIEMLAKNLILELSGSNITINSLAPGATLTNRTLLEQDDFEGSWAKITPLGKIATPCDIANAALFLVSPSSRHITGQCLIVDGGWTSTSPSPNKVI
jgi:glucose 1-dehydrogenase